MYILPIEKIEQRYTGQWFDWISEAYPTADMFGDSENHAIVSGQFLDTFGTNLYKVQQIDRLLQHAKKKGWQNVVFMDLWHPSVVNLAYIRSTEKLNFKIAGILHAGTWDDYDFLTQAGFRLWAKGFERSVIEVVDFVYVASEFHKNLIVDYFEFSKDIQAKFIVRRFPVAKIPYSSQKKENIVVFPHRLTSEKGYTDFDLLESVFSEKYPELQVKFVRTIINTATKKEFYLLLSRAKVSVSCAYQETFGISMIESRNAGAVPLVPNRLSYPELHEACYLYSTFDELVEKVKDNIINYQPPPQYGIQTFTDYFKELE